MDTLAVSTITWTPTRLALLRVAYNNAVRDGVDEFSFMGHKFHTNYAKYLLEYLDLVLPSQTKVK